MLGLEVQPLNPASLVSANPLKVTCAGVELELIPRQPLKTCDQETHAAVPESTHPAAALTPRPRALHLPQLQHPPAASISQPILISSNRRGSSQRNLHHKRKVLPASFLTAPQSSGSIVDDNHRPAEVAPDHIEAHNRKPLRRLTSSPFRTPAVSAPFKRLRTQAIHLQTCHQPP